MRKPSISSNRRTCEACRYWREKPAGIDPENATGFCLLTPNVLEKPRNGWCGQFTGRCLMLRIAAGRAQENSPGWRIGPYFVAVHLER